MKKRIFALLLCVVMVLSITIITSAEDTEAPAADTALTEVPLCTCGTEDDTHADTCPMYIAPEAPAEPEAPTEPEAPAEDTPVCTCGTEDDIHAEDCPLYVAPEDGEQPDEPECTCGTEGDIHDESCPLYEEKEMTFFERVMATTTLDEYDTIMREATDEEYFSMTDEEHTQIKEHYVSLGGIVDIVYKNDGDKTENFTFVAPFVGEN